MVRAFARGAMGRRIVPSWGGPIELHDWCNKGYAVCGILYVERVAYVAAAGFLSHYQNGPLPYV